MQRSIEVGIYDWEAFSSVNGFYPPDIPEEWKLSYFANEFDGACIRLDSPRAYSESLAGWCEDLPDSFELSFCVNHVDQLRVLTELRQQTQISIRYLVVEALDSDILLHTESLQSVLCAAGIGSSEQIAPVDKIWKPETGNAPETTLALFPVIDSMRQYRQWIDQWVQSPPAGRQDQDLTLWLPGATTDYRLLNDCKTLVEMMGY